MFSIVYPDYPHQIKGSKEQPLIWDMIRKKWIVLTPEEWVRQNFIHYLITEKKYPKNCIAIEKKIKVHGLLKRFDLVVYDQSMHPFLLVECKRQGETLSEKVLEQVVNYQSQLQASYFIITNGDTAAGYQLKEGRLQECHAVPDYEEIVKKP